MPRDYLARVLAHKARVAEDLRTALQDVPDLIIDPSTEDYALRITVGDKSFEAPSIMSNNVSTIESFIRANV